jgi:hypothetical protein
MISSAPDNGPRNAYTPPPDESAWWRANDDVEPPVAIVTAVASALPSVESDRP